MNRFLSIALTVIALCPCIFSGNASAQIISTYAGDTTAGNSGDGLAATNAQIDQPYGIATDRMGNLYIADKASNCVRKVNAAGIISTLAGTGVAGYNGDAIAATTAQLNGPVSVAADRLGNVYISDNLNHRIRKVDASGTITTVYWNSPVTIVNPETIAVNWKDDVYFSASGNIYKLVSSAPVLIASSHIISYPISLDLPRSFTFDTLGNMYISNCSGSAGNVFKMDTGGLFTTLVGNNMMSTACSTNVAGVTMGLWGAIGIARDDSGNLFFGEDPDSRVLEWHRTSGIVNTYAGVCHYNGHSGDGDSAIHANIDIGHATNSYNSLAMDTSGNLYIAEVTYHCVRKITRPKSGTLAVQNRNTENTTLSISPNPGSGACSILLPSPVQEQAAVVVINMIGEKMAEFVISTNRVFKADLHLPAGMYVVTARTSQNSYNAKFVVVN